MNKIDAIHEVCDFLTFGRSDAAVETIKKHYPFRRQQIERQEVLKVHCTPLDSTRVFIRDGFVDRYSGDKLVFPPVFRAMSLALPKAFPFQERWKGDDAHPAYWELGAAVDHMIPVKLGGLETESNWVTTSMAHTSEKMNRRLDQVGWRLHAPGDMKKWDGLLLWFLEYTSVHPDVLEISYVQLWHSAASSLSDGH